MTTRTQHKYWNLTSKTSEDNSKWFGFAFLENIITLWRQSWFQIERINRTTTSIDLSIMVMIMLAL